MGAMKHGHDHVYQGGGANNIIIAMIKQAWQRRQEQHHSRETYTAGAANMITYHTEMVGQPLRGQGTGMLQKLMQKLSTGEHWGSASPQRSAADSAPLPMAHLLAARNPAHAVRLHGRWRVVVLVVVLIWNLKSKLDAGLNLVLMRVRLSFGHSIYLGGGLTSPVTLHIVAPPSAPGFRLLARGGGCYEGIRPPPNRGIISGAPI
eukprot:gene9948-biopygen88